MSDVLTIATHGHDCVIGSIIVQALKTHFGAEGASVLDNPVRASLLEEGDQIVLFEDQANRPSTDAAKKAVRAYGFAVSALCRTSKARTDAHALYRAARGVVLGVMPALTAAGIGIAASGVSEGDVNYRVEGLDVGGGLVQGLFSLSYRPGSG